MYCGGLKEFPEDFHGPYPTNVSVDKIALGKIQHSSQHIMLTSLCFQQQNAWSVIATLGLEERPIWQAVEGIKI